MTQDQPELNPEKIMKLRERYRANKSFSVDLDTVSMMLDDINYLLDHVIPADDFGRILNEFQEMRNLFSELRMDVVSPYAGLKRVIGQAQLEGADEALALARKYGSAE